MRKRSNWFSCAGVLALMMMLMSPSFAQNIGVTIDGSPLAFGNVPPAKVNGRVLVPLRGVFEALGAIVDYQASTRTVLAAKGDINLKLQIGSSMAYVDGAPVKLDVPAQVQLGRTLVPLRFVSEALGAQVAWNPGTQTVAITRSASTPPSDEQISTITGSVIRLVANAPATITINTENGPQTYQISKNAQIQRQPKLSSGALGSLSTISLNQINKDELVKLSYNENRQVIRIIDMPFVIPVKVRSVNGSWLTLDDEAGTQILIGDEVSYINTKGQSSNTLDVRAGETVILFISDQTRSIYQISADPADIRMAGASSQPPYNPPASGDVPVINLVQQNTIAPVKAGDVIKVTVRGTAQQKGSFDISPEIADLPLHENNRGVYTGSYRVRAGDDVYQSHVMAHLATRDGFVVSQQSQDPLTIDTKAPLVVGTMPANGATVDVAQPNIVIYTDDHGGSGLVPTTITLINDEKTYQVEATVAPPQSIRAVVPKALSGEVRVNAKVEDVAGNSSTAQFSFTIRANTGPIKSINHNAARTLAAGDALTVEMTAPTGGRASFDLVSEDNPTQVLVQGIPMIEIEARHYRGTYNVLGTRDVGTLIVVGRYRDEDGKLTVKNATTPVSILSKRETGAPTIRVPKDGDNVTSPLVIRGSAAPGNTVQVNVRASGVQYYILPYNNDLGTFKVVANAKGNWHTDSIDLPNPDNVSGLKFVITAVQEDATGHVSPETIITVHPQ